MTSPLRPHSAKFTPHPERSGDVEILESLHALCRKSQVTYAVDGFHITVGHYAPDLVGKPRFSEFNIVQVNFRMEACPQHGLRAGALIRHRDKSRTGDENEPYTEHSYPFAELTWPTIRELYEYHLINSVSSAGISGKGRPPQSLRQD